MAHKRRSLTRLSKEISQHRRRSHNKLDRYDKIREHLVEGKKLGKRDQDFLDKAMKIFPLLCGGNTDREVVQIALRAGIVNTKDAGYKWIAQTKRIFRDAYEYNLMAEKRIMVEMAKKAFKHAMLQQKPTAMVAAVKLQAELLGVFSQKHDLGDVYENLQLPTIVYSSDPKVLQEPPVDGQYEEIKNSPQAEIPAPKSD